MGKNKNTIVISFISLLLAGCLGFGIYKYLTTPRAPNIKAAKGSYLYTAKGLDYLAFIGNKENNRPDVTFTVGSGSVVFTPASGNENPSTPSADGKKAVIFRDVYSNIDFRYQTIPLGVKEEIIVKKATPIRTFPFFLDFKGVTPEYVTDNIKGTTFYDKDKKYLFNFEKPFAVDAKGVRNDNFGISIRKDTETGKYAAIITADDTWMNDPSRAYPITIDPTIVHDTTSEFATGQMNRVRDTGSGSSPNLETYYQEVKSDPYTVALWHMDEASGNLTDASGNGNTGTPTGTTVVGGIISNGRSFNGASDYVTVANSTLLNLSNSGFTISSWVKISNLADSTQHYIVSRYSYGSNTGYGLYVVNSGKVGCDFNGSSGRFESTNAYVTAGQWYHLACRNENGRLSIFVDGVEKESIVRSSALSNYNGNLYLGTPSDGVGNTNYTLSGVIDDVKISNVARTPEEIALDASRRPDSTYTSPVMDLTKALSWNSLSWTGTGFPTGDGETATSSAASNVVAQWNFNETLGTTAASGGTCGASCNGTLTNFSNTSTQDASTLQIASGGSISYSGNYVIHTFTSSGTFTTNSPMTAQVLVVSGGGRGNQGGGGGGGVTYNSAYSISSGSTTVTVGAGGTSGTPTGGTSSFGTVTIGGGSPGGTGIASSGGNSGNGYTGGGNAGGEGSGGGAGAAANGANATGNVTISYGGNGGIGASNSITGTTTYYGGGGGGQGYHGSGTGGSGGGGNGGQSTGSAGTPNTGGGGGGGGSVGANGGSGIVIIRYIPTSSVSGWTGINRRWGTGALTFDGSSNQVVVANNTNLNVTGAITIETWINPSLINGTYQTLIGKWQVNVNQQYVLQIDAENKIGFWVDTNGGDASSGQFHTQGNTILSPGKWYHVAAVFDPSSTSMRVYINGILDGTTTNAGLTTLGTSSVEFSIGSKKNSSGTYFEYFRGIIDSSKIYNKALSASEILSNYNSSNIELQTRVGDSADPNDGSWEAWRPVTGETSVDSLDNTYQYNTTDTGLIDYWPMDETSGSTVTDVKGTGNATATGTTIGDGMFANSRSFKGGTDTIPLSSLGVNTTAGAKNTVEFWVNWDGTGTVMPFGFMGYDLFFHSGCFGFNTGEGNVYGFSSAGMANQWVHVTAVFYNGVPSDTNNAIYINGVKRTLGNCVGTTSANRSVTTSANISGWASDGNYKFTGQIDEFRLYNSELSASTILQHFNAGSTNANTLRPENGTVIKMEGSGSERIKIGQTPVDSHTVGLWRLDETGGTGAYLKDSSGNAYNGTPTGTSTAEGISGKSRSFNGSTESVSFSGPTWTPTTFSVEFWINPATCTDYNQGVQATNGWGAFYFHTTSTCSLYVGTDVTNRFTPTDIPANTLTLNQWQHFAYTYDGTAGRLYKNGVLIAGPKTQVASTAWGGFSLTNQINGKVDEIRISNVARSNEEIAEAYRMGRDHRISETITSTNLSSATKLPFYVAADRLGTFSQLTIGESAYTNYEPDSNTAGLWHLDDNTSVSATGGTITYSGGYTIHKFTSSGTFTPTGDMNVEVLVVGGGGGGANVGGGGGGGGYAYYSIFPISRQAYTVTVGNGGAQGTNGQNSVFSTITATGGGRGGDFNGTGANGGSGGGGGPSSTTQLTGGTGSQGSNGGSGGNNTNWGGGGGGGGAGGVGSSAGTGVNGVNGGVGLANSISGSTVYYAGGGGGGEVFGTAVGTGGNGGGGNANLNAAGSNGSPNTGGGGGGGSWNTAGIAGGTGGSGVVIIRYKTSDTVVKDATGGSVSGNTASASFVQGKIGKARSFNGTSDYISIPDSTSLNPTSAITIDYWVKPTATGMQLNKGIWNEYYTYRGSSGNISLTLYTSAGSLEQYSLSSFDNDGQWHHFAATWSNSDGKIRVYKDGVLDAVSGTTLTGTINSQTNALTIGSGVDAGGYYFGGSLDEVRISNIARTADEIRQTYEFGARTHNITFDFKAKLASGNLITGSGDYSFTVDETAYGSSAMANHLFLGDKIIVKENYDGTEYIAQGTVNSVNSSTGAVTVASWDAGSTFPSGGFTVNATVFKWQREYFDITGIPSFQKDALTRLTYRITDGSQGANIWLDDIRSSTGYLTTPGGSTITSSTGKRYFQYRAILSQNSLPAPSAALTSVTLDYISNLAPSTPSLDSPENGATGVLWTPQLKTTTVDLDSDYLEYKIVLCKDAGMSVSCQTFDQTSSQTGWSGQNTQSGTAYNTGTQAVYTVQTALDIGTTYYWKSYAIDPAGTNTWSATQTTPGSFTTLAAPFPASNCRIQETPNDTSLTVIWNDNATNENAYEVQRSVDGAAFTALHTGLAVNTVTDTDSSITEGHTYQYRVAPYFTGPSYAPWCTTSTLSLQLGEFSVKGLDLKGLNLK